jgi:hypothetical protein
MTWREKKCVVLMKGNKETVVDIIKKLDGTVIKNCKLVLKKFKLNE